MSEEEVRWPTAEDTPTSKRWRGQIPKTLKEGATLQRQMVEELKAMVRVMVERRKSQQGPPEQK